MTVRRLHLGDFHPNLERSFAQSLGALCPGGDARGVLVVVPNRLLATHLRRRAAELGTATLGLRPRALEDLIEELAAPVLARQDSRRIPGWAEAVIVGELLGRGPAAPWRASDGRHGWAPAVASTLRDLRDALVEPAAYSAAAVAAGLDSNERIRALVDLYPRYVARLRRRPGLADAAAATEAAVEALAAGRVEKARRAIFIYGLYDLVGRQRRFLEALVADRGLHTEAFFPWGAGAAFNYAMRLRDWFVETLGFEPWHDDPPLPYTNLFALRGGLFAEARGTALPPDDSVRWLSTPSEGGEPLEVIRRLITAPAGTALVLLRQEEPAGERFRSVERMTGVPLHQSGGPLRRTAAGRTAALLVRMARDWRSSSEHAEGAAFSRAAVEELLATGGLAPGVFPPGSRPERWVQALRGRGVVAGLEAWRSFVERHGTATASAQAALPFPSTDAAVNDEEDRERDPKLARELPALADWVARLLAACEALAGKGRAWTWARRTEQAGEVLSTWLADSPARDRLLAEIAALAALDGVLPATFAHFLAACEAIGEIAIPPAVSGPARLGDAPTVAALAAVRGLTADRVVLPGLIERTFPRRAQEDPVLLDVERLALNEKAHLDLPLKKRDALAEDRLLFRLAIGAARQELLLSWPRRGEDGRQLITSSFLLAAAEAIAGRHLSFQELAEAGSAAHQALAIERVPLAATTAAHPPLLGSESDLREVERARAGGELSRLAMLHAAYPGFGPSLRAELARRGRPNRTRLSAYDGLVDAELAKAWLARRRDERSGAPRFSPSALQTYAGCSFRFFQQEVLNLRSNPPPERHLDLDPRTAGSVYHAALRDLFALVLADDLWPLSDPSRLAGAQALVEPVLEGLLRRQPRLVADLPAALWQARRRRVAADLREVLARVATEEGGWTPRYVELPFGLEGAPPLALEIGGVSVALRGRIDRVDEGPLGVRIVDYKSGRMDEAQLGSPGSVRAGERLQLPLYRHALERLRRERGEPPPSAVYGAYQGVERASGHRTISWEPEHFAAAEVALQRIVPAIAHGVAAGEFFQVERDTFCERLCDFRPVCGPGRAQLVEEKRVDPRAARAAEWRELRTLDDPDDEVEAG